MRMVLLRIADQAGHLGENSWPGIQTIANDCNLSTRQVQKCLNGLVEQGELLVFHNAGGSKDCPADRRPNRYEMPLLDGWLPPEYLTPKSDPFGHMKAVFALQPAETDGVNPTTPRGVNHTTPRTERGELHDTPGVNSRTQRGEPQGNNGVNSTTPDMPLDLPLSKSSSAREADTPVDGPPDYSGWQPAAATIQRIKKIHPEIKDQFLADILPEFLTYAESNKLKRHELNYKFMSNATRQLGRSRKKPAAESIPRGLTGLTNWALRNAAPDARVGESTPEYRRRLVDWIQAGRPDESKPGDDYGPVMDLPGVLDDEMESAMKDLHGCAPAT